MRKAWKAVFRENKYTVKFYRYLLIITAITIGMIFSDELFGYFVFDDIVRAGDVLYYTYVVCISLIAGVGFELCQNKCLFRIILSGATPAMVVLTIRWCLAGFITARILVIIFVIYFFVMCVQLVNKLIKKKNIFYAILQCFYKSFSVITLISIMGAAGYCATGNGPSDRSIQIELINDHDNKGWDANQEMLSMWKEDTYTTLQDTEKKQLWQSLIDLESNYLGVESPALEIEEYDINDNKDGYYSKEKNMISITDKAMDYSRERVLNILLHEINHAYTEAIADSVDWKDMDDKDKKLRMYVDAYIFKAAYENYTLPEEDRQAYYDNAAEVSARAYSEEWEEKYFQYIDEL